HARPGLIDQRRELRVQIDRDAVQVVRRARVQQQDERSGEDALHEPPPGTMTRPRLKPKIGAKTGSSICSESFATPSASLNACKTVDTRRSSATRCVSHHEQPPPSSRPKPWRRCALPVFAPLLEPSSMCSRGKTMPTNPSDCTAWFARQYWTPRSVN